MRTAAAGSEGGPRKPTGENTRTAPRPEPTPSIFATLQTELLDRHAWPTRDSLRVAIFEFIEDFDNRRRRHKHLGLLSPDAFEKRWSEQQAQAVLAST